MAANNVFHCKNCGLYLDHIVAYHWEDYKIEFKFCPMCGEKVLKDNEQLTFDEYFKVSED